VRNFKFLTDNDEEIYPIDEELYVDEFASWMWSFNWDDRLSVLPHEVVTTRHDGIRDFLDMFPPNMIVPVIKISGNVGGVERIHTGVEEYEDGWGFDITNDLITIDWIRFNDI
jgi:hypothetical protein